MTGSLLVGAAGWAGGICLLVAYAWMSGGRRPVGLPYHLLNLVGAVGLAVNSAVHRAWPSAILNVVWLAIGLATLYRIRPGSYRIRPGLYRMRGRLTARPRQKTVPAADRAPSRVAGERLV